MDTEKKFFFFFFELQEQKLALEIIAILQSNFRNTRIFFYKKLLYKKPSSIASSKIKKLFLLRCFLVQQETR